MTFSGPAETRRRGSLPDDMRTISLCTPVYGRYELTEILLRERKRTFARARAMGVECACVVIGDDDNLDTARGLGFATIEAPNMLGRKYNDGHEWAVRQHFDVSFQVNSDQTFDPALLVAVAEAPLDCLIQTRWLTAIHRRGDRAIVTWNPMWSMTAYPTRLLRRVPRPCDESLDRMCDSGTRAGVQRANPDALTHEIVLHPLETVQYESWTQLTPWSRHVKVALANGRMEVKPPWDDIARQHSPEFVREIRSFYGA